MDGAANPGFSTPHTALSARGTDRNGSEIPGLYRQSDGFVYVRNSNTQGNFSFGNPGDVPLAGDFNGDGCDTVSVYRQSEGRVYVINRLGDGSGGLGAADYTSYFGNPGDRVFVGDFTGDGVDTVGLHRESTGLVDFRNTNTQGIADVSFIFGNPGDRMVAAGWTGDGIDTVGLYRPSTARFFFRFTNTQGNTDAELGWRAKLAPGRRPSAARLTVGPRSRVPSY